MYQICIRQEAGNCAICYTPAFQANAADMQDSFGIRYVTMTRLNTQQLQSLNNPLIRELNYMKLADPLILRLKTCEKIRSGGHY